MEKDYDTTYRLLKIVESLMFAVFFGFVPIYFCLIVTIFISSVLFGTKIVEAWVLWSLVPAVLTDIISLKKWVKRAYLINSKILAAIFVFYSIIALGMFMGIPIGVLVLGIAAGFYIARKMQLAEADERIRQKNIKKTAVFCAAVMALICCLITLWAILGQMIGYKLQTPFLSLTFTVPVFIGIILTGSAILVVLEYFLASFTAKFTTKFLYQATLHLSIQE